MLVPVDPEMVRTTVFDALRLVKLGQHRDRRLSDLERGHVAVAVMERLGLCGWTVMREERDFCDKAIIPDPR